MRTNNIKNLGNLYDIALGAKLVELMGVDHQSVPWKIVRLEEICQSFLSGFAEGKKKVEGGTIHLRMNNIGINFEINLDLIRTINASPEQIRKYKLEYGDIVFNNTNSTRLVGKSAVFNMPELCLYSNHLTRIRPNTKLVLSEWILFYLRALWIRRDFERMCNKWINQASVNAERIKNLKIPIPPIENQKNIIKDLQNIALLMTTIKEKAKLIRLLYDQEEDKMKNIEERILGMAYSGRLTN